MSEITFAFPTTGVSGGLRAVVEISNELERRGHNVTICVPTLPLTRPTSPRELASAAIHTWKRHGDMDSIDWIDTAATVKEVPSLHPLFARFLPDAEAVIATWWKTAEYVPRYPESKGEPLYFVQHFETHAGPEQRVVDTYRADMPKVCTSPWLTDKVKAVDGSGTVHGPIAYGVDHDMFYKEDDGYDVSEPVTVGMMYNFGEWKGSAEGIEAYRRATQQSDIDTELVLYGKAEPDTLPVDAEFHVLPEQDRLRQLYNQMDLFVMPSHHEGFGMPPMEAMACGTAVLATDVGGVPVYGRTEDGDPVVEIVPPRDVDALTDALTGLLEHKQRIADLAEAGHRRIQDFTWERCADEFEEIVGAELDG